LPLALQFAIPLSMLTASLQVASRMETDGEISALNASGVPVGAVARPILAAAALLSVVSIFLLDITGPMAEARLRQAKFDIAQQLQTSFRSGLCDLELGPARISFEAFQGNTFRDVCLELREENGGEEIGQAQIWRAETGALSITEEEQVVLALHNWRVVLPFATESGEAHISGSSFAARHPLDIFLEAGSRKRRRNSMVAWELAYVGARGVTKEMMHRTNEHDAMEQLARRTALGGSAFFFALIGFPLGILVGRGGHAGRFLFALAPVLVLYFPLVIVGSSLARKGGLPAYPALWSGNVLICLMSIWMYRRITYR
jgi:lipopolysaccharide export LptBFGC system permease protein LptF